MSEKELTVLTFLKEFKRLMSQRKYRIISCRPKNMNTLTILGITETQRDKHIENIIKDDYSFGPTPDHDRPGNIWVFGKEINGYELYIKLKINTQTDGKKALCISFHIAERPLDYPFK